MHPLHSLEGYPSGLGYDLCSAPPSSSAALTEPGLLFFPPPEILDAIAQRVDPAAGTSGLLMAALERLKDPLLVNPPFSLQDAA